MPSSLQAPAAAGASPQQEAPVVRGVVVTGARFVPSDAVAAAAAKVAFGKPGTPELIHDAVGAIVRAYRSRGLPVAEVTATDLTPDGILHITVAEGTVRRIVVRGNRHTRRDVILEAMALQPGDVYRESVAHADRNRLARLGIFTDIAIAPVVPDTVSETADRSGADTNATDATAAVPPPATDTTRDAASDEFIGMVDVLVRVKEDKTGNVAATLGYGDGSGLTGFLELSEANFQGDAQRILVQWQRSGRSYFDDDGYVDSKARQAFDVSFQRPIIGPHSVGYGIDVYNKETVFFPLFASYNDTIRNYETRRGATIRVGAAASDKLSLFVSARHDTVGYDSVPSQLNPPLPLLDDAAATIGAVAVNLVLDGRDEPDNPRHGYLNSLVYETAGRFAGGNRAFRQMQADLRGYAALTRNRRGPVLAMRLMGGTTDGDNVPLSEYFWLGGYDLLRGYDLYSIYGTSMFLGTVEVRAPITTAVQGVVFVDSGNAYRDGYSSGGLKTGAGVGVRFLTPIGPIRFDVAHGGRGFQSYVSLGQNF